MATKTFFEKLEAVRKSAKIFKANKGKNYSYYKLEELTDVIAPLLEEHGLRYEYACELVPLDMQARVFLKTTVTVTDGTEQTSMSVFHELPPVVKLMSEQQMCNSTATFGRKLALEMLFHVDIEDPIDNMAKEQGTAIPRTPVVPPVPNF